MKRRVTGLILLGFLAGCTSDWDPERRVLLSDPRTDAGEAIPAVIKRRPSSFAALPDRGELLAYGHRRDVRQRGAYTSHPVDLSEEHAFRASYEGGDMVVTAPDGRLIRLGYERHIEHHDGNWTWIGRDADGIDAVLTFGEKAVFGTIPNGRDEALRLTTSGGRSWLVSTDRSLLFDPDRRAAQAGKTDYLIPPKAAIAAAAAAVAQDGTTETLAGSELTAQVAAVTVDLVLGYTNGLASELGGTSQAETLLNNLVELTNQAYSNSQVAARVRMVRSVAVNYPDNTNNNVALQALTGVTCTGQGGSLSCVSAPVPAALQPIVTARGQYGGDLVSLVRDFRAPENDGCGIAWLLGANQTAITAESAAFGYSVVGYGQDINESDGRNYGCRDDSLAHELGHNMGQAHTADSSGPGAHAYSYGYRETSTSGFHTVMAYPLPDSSQFGILYFANPNVNHPGTGRPTGVANASDNTRSMSQTMPIVATFRATQVANPQTGVRNDSNGDGKSDIIWRNVSSEQIGRWYMNGPARIGGEPPDYMPANYRIVGTGDFDGDGRGDLLWTDNLNTHLLMWRAGADGRYQGSYVDSYPAGWMVAGIVDSNGDGKSDIIWRNVSSEQIGRWYMNGPARIGGEPPDYMPASYRIVGMGDFDGDGHGDLLWTDNLNTHLLMWRAGANGRYQGSYVDSYPAGWMVVNGTF